MSWFQVASELNAAILEIENRESTPKLANLLKLLLWAQDELDNKKVKYPKMTDLARGEIEEAKWTQVVYLWTLEKETGGSAIGMNKAMLKLLPLANIMNFCD